MPDFLPVPGSGGLLGLLPFCWAAVWLARHIERRLLIVLDHGLVALFVPLGFLGEDGAASGLIRSCLGPKRNADNNGATGDNGCRAMRRHCGVLESIPLIGWMAAPAGCRKCDLLRTRWDCGADALAIVSGIATGIVLAGHLPLPTLLAWLTGIILIGVVDSETGIIPDAVVLPFLWTGLGLAAIGMSLVSANEAVVGAVFVYCFFALARFVAASRWLLRTRSLIGLTYGMANGDIKFAAAIAAWTGAIPAILAVIMAMTLRLAQVGLIRLTRRPGDGGTTPGGPYIVAAVVLTMIALCLCPPAWRDVIVHGPATAP